jgi:outer membrane protein assembly factor BamA
LQFAGAALLLALSTACRSAAVALRPVDPRLVFDGAPIEDTRALAERIAPWIEEYDADGRDPIHLDDAAFELEEFYRDRGYSDARASFVAPGPDGRLRFELETGSRYAVERLTFVGLTWFDADEGQDFYGFPSGSRDGRSVRWFTPGELAAGSRRLEDALYMDGHLDAEVASRSIRADSDSGTVSVEVEVIEGPRYRLESLELTGLESTGLESTGLESTGLESTGVAPGLLEPLRGELAPYLEQPFGPRLVFDLESVALEFLGNRGFADASLASRLELDPASGAAALELVIDPGLRVTVSELRIEGAQKTRPSFVRSRLRLAPGEVFSRARARESFERLFRSGLFDRVAVQLGEGTPDARPLVVSLTEAPSQELFVEPGYGAYELARIKAGYRERNLFGTGRRLRIEGVASVRSLGAEIGVTDPDFLRDDLEGDVAVAVERRQEPGFLRTQYSAAFGLRWPWARDLDGNLIFEYRRVDLSDLDVNVLDPDLAEETIGVASVLFSPQFDSRDNPFVPSSGHTAEIGMEWASSIFGSQLDFIRPTLTATSYRSLAPHGSTVLALGARIGWIVPASSTETIPLQERFYNGGPTTVRAFGRFELGPTDADGDPLGGEGQTVVNVELRQRLSGKVSGALFYDLGSLAPSYEELGDLTRLVGGPGVGLRYMLPIGPLRIDVGINADPGPFDDDWVLHVAIGMPF